jgi:hypothetical protein
LGQVEGSKSAPRDGGGSIEHRHAAPARKLGVEAGQEVVPLLVAGRSGKLGHTHVPGVEPPDESLDRTALARGIPSLEHHTHRGTEGPVSSQATQHQPQVEQAPLGGGQPGLLLVPRQAERQVNVIEAGHAPIEARGRRRRRRTRS